MPQRDQRESETRAVASAMAEQAACCPAEDCCRTDCSMSELRNSSNSN